MSELIRDRVCGHLERLGLLRVREILPEILEQAGDSTHLEVLDQLLCEEVAAKEDRRLRATLSSAGLPFEKTIEEYDFSFHPQLDRRSVMSLFELSFIQEKENAIFLGPPGVGKSHLAVALALKAAHFGFSICFTTMAALMERLRADEASGKVCRHRKYLKSALVVVDEVGYMPVERRDAHLFFRFICYRYEKSSTIITSNKGFTDWQELFGDPVIATAILDRLLHHCHVINIKGNSYRLREYQRRKEALGPAVTIEPAQTAA